MLPDTARRLAEEIRSSPECREYARAREALEGSDTARALLREYRRLQLSLQMAAMAGRQAPQEEAQRFSQIAALLYGGTETSAFLMAEMRLQQMLSEVLKLLTDAAGLQMDLPGIP